MNKIILFIVLALCVTGLSFAEFEGTFGIIGGFGPAAEIGLNLQLGYLSPKGTDEKPASFRWGLLTDFGVGLRYKYLNDAYGEYSYYEHSSTGDIPRSESYHMNSFGYNMGLLAEFYFLPFMGIALGGGVTNGAGSYSTYNSDEGSYDGNPFTPYIRAEIPFLFEVVKLGVGFDYILWQDEPVPKGITLPPGYRINLFLRLRGEAALAFFKAGWL